MNQERIAKVIARSGVCSRREAERWIQSGRVQVNGQWIDSPALNVSCSDAIKVDGKRLSDPEKTRLWLFHKPKGALTTHRDPQERRTVFDFLLDMPRVISVGRLDYNTEGFLLLTNDGQLARRLELPKTGLMRRYRVRVHGELNDSKLQSLKKGLTIRDPRTRKRTEYKAIEIRIERVGKGSNHWVSFSLKEGKNREIRNVCKELNLDVSRLIRVSYGPFQLNDLRAGQVREVPREELEKQIKSLDTPYQHC